MCVHKHTRDDLLRQALKTQSIRQRLMVEEGGAGQPGEELDTKKRLRPGKQNEKELRESIKEGRVTGLPCRGGKRD